MYEHVGVLSTDTHMLESLSAVSDTLKVPIHLRCRPGHGGRQFRGGVSEDFKFQVRKRLRARLPGVGDYGTLTTRVVATVPPAVIFTKYSPARTRRPVASYPDQSAYPSFARTSAGDSSVTSRPVTS